MYEPGEEAFARAVAELSFANPFLPVRIQYEQEALGSEFQQGEPVWSLRADDPAGRRNVRKLGERVEALAERLRARLAARVEATKPQLQTYEELILYLLFNRYSEPLNERIVAAEQGKRRGTEPVEFFEAFQRDAQFFLALPHVRLPGQNDPPHLFACFYQVRRAFHQIYSHIIGGSMPAARLRAAVWQSIFTHDMRRYRRALFQRMGDITTLVTGPSGTGKELVARAIGLSRYIPFDAAKQSFTEEVNEAFVGLNLSALSPSLIESELFGHSRGAFTGANVDRSGWLEICRPLGTVFLDEIGDLDQGIQVKLLRVLQTRRFQRLGETQDRRFSGKIIAATNRHLAADMHEGRFRHDLYYRLCSDLIQTPSLYEQLRDSPGELYNLVLFLAHRQVSDEAPNLAQEVVSWIDQHLGRDYAWPGNIRELEQCLRNVLVRAEYRPARIQASTPCHALGEAVRDGRLTADQLLGQYSSMIYAQTGSYEETARRLQVDRRTAKRRVDPSLVREFRGQ